MSKMSNANDKRKKRTNSMYILRRKNRTGGTKEVAKIERTGGMKQINKQIKARRKIIKEKEKKAKQTNTKDTKLTGESGVV